jgi:hypothetical protein
MIPSTVAPRNRLHLLVTIAPLLLLAGCVPVLWLPDSSGFLYVSNKGSAMLYDVVSSKKKVILEKLPGDSMWPALSPDGKKFAVASMMKKEEPKKQFEVRVHIFDFQGKEVHCSPSFVWRDADSGADNRTTAIFWARARDRLIIHDYMDSGKCGIYDPEKKTLLQVNGMPAPFGGSPIRPDDKGFLITRAEDEKLAMFFVDWSGKEQAIKVDEAIGKEEDRAQVVQSPWRGTSIWDNSTAIVTFKSWLVRVDTEKRTAKLEKAPAEKLYDGPLPVVQKFDFPGKGAKIRVVQEKTKDDKAIDRILLWKPDAKKAEEVLSVKSGFFMLSPSPDGKWLVIRGLGDDVKDLEFLLVSKDGEVRNRPER